jgi:hypothetical protein
MISFFSLISTLPLVGASAMDELITEYLSDIAEERGLVSTQAFGHLGFDTAVVPGDGRPAQPLRIKDKTYSKGLGHHAPGEMVIDLDGEYLAFEAELGVQWQGGKTGSVVFQIFVDGKKAFETGVMKETDEAVPVKVPLVGADTLRLVVTDAGDGITCDCADWAEARLLRAGPGSPKPERPLFDIAPFGHVATWDPNRKDGAHCNRVQEFPPEDVFLETPLIPSNGTYDVPASGCIGLQWAERRAIREARIEFADASTMPSVGETHLEFWTGESPWQGSWKPLAGDIQVKGSVWTLLFDPKKNSDLPSFGTEKIRWILFSSQQPIRVKHLSAFTRSRWEAVGLRIEAAKGAYEEVGHIEVYNGEIVGTTGQEPRTSCPWDLGTPLHLKVRAAKPKPNKSDRTLLNFTRANGGFSVAVESVLANGSVYLKDLGVFVALESNPQTLDEARTSLDGKQTVLERVREMPDQTFAKSMEHVHNPVQDLGPMMVSLACDNYKFAVHREGMIEFNRAADNPHLSWGSWKGTCKMVPGFGSGKPDEVTRHLEGEWMPIPVTTVKEGGITYTQKSFVAPVGEPVQRSPWLFSRSLCVSEWTIENTGQNPSDVGLDLSFSVEGHPVTILTGENGFTVKVDEVILAGVNSPDGKRLSVEVQGDRAHLKGALAPGEKAVCVAQIPGWEIKPGEDFLPADVDQLLKATKEYWQRILATAIQIEVPDPLLNNVYRASQVHCLLAARNDPKDGTIAAWISSDRYGPLESEAHSVILGMDRMGQTKFAQRALDYFIKQYNRDGFLTTGYTLMGTGWHLWTLAEHFGLSGDTEWMKRIAPEVERVCGWIDRQRKKTERVGPNGEKPPEYGLMPPGVAADWNRFAYRFALQGHFYAGLAQASQALAAVGRPQAEQLEKSANSFREDIRRAYEWSVAKTPAVQLTNGAWVPADPSMVYCFGPSGEGFPGEDGNRSWCYDVELGSHHLVPTGVIDPQSRETGFMIDHLEDVQFLSSGMGDYPGEKSREDWFNLGGFSKVQPYYSRIADVYALRDEVKPFIRSYFNAIPSLLSRENLSFWEHFHNTGGWNKTHETGWFLAQTRTMFVMERGEELWLAPFVTNQWLKEGMEVKVANAPTRFGPVGYRLVSKAAEGRVSATIDAPQRNPPKRIVIRIRHPEGKPMRSVKVNGDSYTDFDVEKECVRIRPEGRKITVEASY